jgi:regulatory protein
MRTRSKRAALLTEEAAREQCLRLLARRARSAEELRRRLRTAGFEQNTIEAVLAELERVGLVDDEEFARLWVEDRRQGGQAGRRKLRWELRRKGISDDLIRASVDEAIDDETEVEQALVAARRRLGDKPADVEALLRLRRYLLGRGYSYGTVEAALRRISAEPREG